MDSAAKYETCAAVKRNSRERNVSEAAIVGLMLGSGSKVRVRSGKPADATALARIFKEAWQLAYRGIIPHLHLESMVRQRSPEWWRDALKTGDSALVLEMAGTVAGYATIGSSRQRGPFQGGCTRSISIRSTRGSASASTCEGAATPSTCAS